MAGAALVRVRRPKAAVPQAALATPFILAAIAVVQDGDGEYHQPEDAEAGAGVGYSAK
jgi:hypothetical protein